MLAWPAKHCHGASDKTVNLPQTGVGMASQNTAIMPSVSEATCQH
jgi:hypothetical protein